MIPSFGPKSSQAPRGDSDHPGTAFLTGMRPNELIALNWINVDFEMRVVTVREGRVQGVEGAPKTLSSYRGIDMLDPLLISVQV